MDCKIIKIKTVDTNESGSLSFFESTKDIPFEIKRIYYIHDVPEGVLRGGHAHKTLKQLLFCPYGSIKIILNDGHQCKNIILDSASSGLLLQPGLWRDMQWLKDNSVLCVAASDYYDEKDYIRNYDEFVMYIKEKENNEGL
jgi:dTDP-4-dehydrorhamnose 3,5-epimerase-like enzyme